MWGSTAGLCAVLAIEPLRRRAVHCSCRVPPHEIFLVSTGLTSRRRADIRIYCYVLMYYILFIGNFSFIGSYDSWQKGLAKSLLSADSRQPSPLIMQSFSIGNLGLWLSQVSLFARALSSREAPILLHINKAANHCQLANITTSTRGFSSAPSRCSWLSMFLPHSTVTTRPSQQH